MWIRVVIYFISSILVIDLNIWYNIYQEIDRRIYVKHIQDATFASVIMGTLCIFIFSLPHWTLYGLNGKLLICSIISFPIIRWLLLDPWENLRRNKPFLYIGELKDTSSIDDKFLHAVNKFMGSKRTDTSGWQYVIKVIVLLITTFIDYKIIIF